MLWPSIAPLVAMLRMQYTYELHPACSIGHVKSRLHKYTLSAYVT